MAVLRSVAKTDTFEIFRQKVNQIASDVFSIQSGGSDLSTGNLKLGDGTRTNPALAFLSDSSLGIYKPSQKTLGYVSDGKILSNFSLDGLYSFRDFIVRKNSVQTSGILVTNFGSNYDAGTYTDIALLGGTGQEATIDLTVTEFSGTITNSGSGYVANDYTNILLTGGSGSGVSVEFTVLPLEVSITNAGTLYGGSPIIPTFNNVPLSNISSSGTGAEASVFIGVSGEIQTITITNSGSGYQNGDTLTIDSADLGGTGSGLILTVSNNPGEITSLAFTSKGSGYLINDVLTLPTGVNQTVTLSDTSADVTIANLGNISTGYLVTYISGTGQIANNTTVQSVNPVSNTVTLSALPTTAGSATLRFIPPYGEGSSAFSYTINALGTIEEYDINNGGSGYNNGDILSIDSKDLVQPIEYAVQNKSIQKLQFTNTLASSTFSVGNTVKKADGAIQTITVSTSSNVPGAGGNSYTGVSSTSATGSGATFNVSRDPTGNVSNVTISSGGILYAIGDTVTIPGASVGGATPADNITLTVDAVSTTTELTVHYVKTAGANIDYILVDYDSSLISNDFLVKVGSSTAYQISSASGRQYRYFIDLGSGYAISPSLTLYVGSIYKFDLSDSSNQSHQFALSKFRDGIWGPSYIQDLSTTLSIATKQITVSDTTGILPGMEVILESGDGAITNGTTVDAVLNSTTLTLSSFPTTSGSAVVSFRGVAYTDGVISSSNSLTIKVTETTPNLYYYCAVNSISHVDEGGYDNEEALITINPNNPKQFGQGFSATVNNILVEDVVSANVNTGNLTAVKFVGPTGQFTNCDVTETLTSALVETTDLTVSNIDSTSLQITASTTNLNSPLNIGSTIQINNTTGGITTSGIIRTNSTLNISNILTLTGDTITSTPGNDIKLSPAVGRIAKVSSSSALIIPAGTSAQRPSGAIVEDGAIRFNKDTNQYEGYSATTSSWSSLGGVRDLDGNTYIAAEAFTGANDNILYFYNDNNNTLKLTRTYLDFNTVKSLRSLDVNLPLYTEWVANTPVTLGSFVKYRNNLYEVSQSGTTGTSGTEPTHTTGTQANGTATLTWHSSAVAPLTFDQISELRIGPNGGLPLVINSDLRLANNVISTDVNDLVLRPNSGKKVSIDAMTSLVIPSGDSNTRGLASQGSIRYNTTITQFEGYNGSNWTSLGGVKDVDGNTYIIPESSPGANENILYFYNDGENTLKLSKTDLKFETISKITSTIDSLEITAGLLTFNNVSTSIDTTGLSTFISTTKDNLDFGLSVGLNNDYLLRMNNVGEFIVNRAFGTGANDEVVLITNDLKDFELDDTKLSTADIILVKGTTNTGASNIYSPLTASGAKLVICAHNITNNTTEMIEFTVIDKDLDIFNSEYGNVNTGDTLINVSFDFNAQGDVRVNIALDDLVTTGDQVNITVVKNVIKK